MSNNSDDKLLEDLRQIRKQQEKVCNDLDRIKQDTPAEYLEDLEKIEHEAYNTIIEIDKIKDNLEQKLENVIEINTYLHRIRPGRGWQRIGNVFI